MKIKLSVSRERSVGKSHENNLHATSSRKDLESKRLQFGATSSSSKVFGSSRRASLQEVNASPVGSVSSSLLKAPNLDKQIIRSLHQEFAMTDLEKYVVEILDRKHMVNCNPSRTLIDTESKLRSDVQQVYLYMHDPWKPHYLALKRILRAVFILEKYVVEILDRKNMVNCNPSRTLIDTESKLRSDVQQVYLYMHDPWNPHYLALKRILRLEIDSYDEIAHAVIVMFDETLEE
nr:cullin, conserved site-containing protein [Tanacetum cinerariifolium]